MSLVALKCPHCGGDIQLDSDKEFGFCMHCGTKIMVQEAVNRNVRIDHSDRLNNLIDIAKKQISSGSAADLLDISNKILELDSKNWCGWFVKGVAHAKDAKCAPMYEAWCNAVKEMSTEEYLELRSDFVNYAALASIGFGVEKKLNGLPIDFLSEINDKEPDDKIFEVDVINTMVESGMFCEDTSYNSLINASQIVNASLILFPNLFKFLIEFEALDNLAHKIYSTRYAFGANEYGILSKDFKATFAPYQIIYNAICSSKHSDEEFNAAIDYWLNVEESEYMDILQEVIDMDEELSDASGLKEMMIRKKMKKKVEEALQVYFNHP